jgi:hypothetical protein
MKYLSGLFYLMPLFVMPLFAYDSPSIGNIQVFPSDNPWNWDISSYDVHPNSAAYINTVGSSRGLHPDFGTVWNDAPNGIPYVTVSGVSPLVNVTFTDFGDESDAGPYRVPLDAQIEGGSQSEGDRHVIAVDTTNKILYELYSAFPQTSFWNASSGAIFDLKINDHHPLTYTSADAAGLPIFPGLVRYEEAVVKKEINHAIRMTVQLSQKAFIFPARHYASSSTDPTRPPMGLRFRLKSGFNISSFSPEVQVILKAFKKYGLIVADNGSNWYISGAPDSRWNDDNLSALSRVKGSDFEAITTVDASGNPIYPKLAVKRSANTITSIKAANGNQSSFDFRGRQITTMPKGTAAIIIHQTNTISTTNHR